jgi:hypothetical protein
VRRNLARILRPMRFARFCLGMKIALGESEAALFMVAII